MKPTLVIMAAGMGSRYGGLKQIDPIGPGGEIVMDYSIFDALRAGFGKVVFIIRKDIETTFREVIEPHVRGRIPFEYVYQELEKIPAVVSLCFSAMPTIFFTTSARLPGSKSAVWSKYLEGARVGLSSLPLDIGNRSVSGCCTLAKLSED